ncbi:hypothetical protein ACFQU1_09045 [Chelatococcus sp. GCM10030263]|uniref:hypothetical protein n=1 Tax=Chelatococcus sp. GCM10030263 TaxID=3273387 RepID=UPI00360D2EA1
MVVAGDAIRYAREALLQACDMAFDEIAAGTASIRTILARADRITPGHFPELRRTEAGSSGRAGAVRAADPLAR